MRPLRLHYFLGYAMIGAVSPFLPEYFRSERQLSPAEIGVVFSCGQLCVFVTPALLTLLADRRVSARAIAASVYLLAAAALLALWRTDGFVGAVVWYTCYSLAFTPLFALQDGLFFEVQRERVAAGLPVPAYHQVRVLGTLGYILPSAPLLLLIPKLGGLTTIFPVGAVFALLAAANAGKLSRAGTQERKALTRSGVPTKEAGRALLAGRTWLFCAAVALLQLTNSAYYLFYPVYLVQALGVEQRWLGMISTVGVSVEALLVLAFGWLCARIGPGRLLAWGALLAGLRLVIVAVAPNALPAILANALHGPIIVGTLVAPVVFINRLAGDHFRNSIQGLFAMAVLGAWRLVGNLVCGWAAEIDTRVAFGIGTAAALVAALIVFGWVKDPPESGTT